jgi:hypothetical protein
MQAWLPPRLDPPAEIRLEDNLQRKGLVKPQAPRPRDGAFSATVEVVGRVDDREERLQTFQDWLHQDLAVAFQAPPPTLDAVQLCIFMSNPTDPMKAIRDQVLFTRGWYQAPLQVEAQERARVDALYR